MFDWIPTSGPNGNIAGLLSASLLVALVVVVADLVTTFLRADAAERRAQDAAYQPALRDVRHGRGTGRRRLVEGGDTLTVETLSERIRRSDLVTADLAVAPPESDLVTASTGEEV